MDSNFYPIILRDDDHQKRAEIFWKIQDEGLDKTIFYALHAPNIKYFVEACALPNGWTIPVYTPSGDLAAAGWLNSFTGRMAFCHFVVFKKYQAHGVEIGKRWLGTVWRTKGFDSLCGLTPITYRHALRFIQKLGFTLSPLRVPGACHLVHKNRYADGVFSVIYNPNT